MSALPHNIDRSVLAGYFVGSAKGDWRISRTRDRNVKYRATKIGAPEAPVLTGQTLLEISAKLEAYAKGTL